MHIFSPTSRFALALLLAVAFQTSTPLLLAETMVVLNPAKDNTLINSVDGSVSHGASDSLYSGKADGRGGPGNLRAVIAFDINSAIPAGSIITDVQLELNALKAGPGSGDDSYTIHRLLKDWGEGTSNAFGGAGAPSTPGDATWIHTFFDTETWSNPGGDFEAAPSATETVSGLGLKTWGSTPQMIADVQSWLDNPASDFGWILIGDESTSASARQFGSRESTSAAPALKITYVPEPGTLGLIFIGLLLKPSNQRVFSRNQL